MKLLSALTLTLVATAAAGCGPEKKTKTVYEDSPPVQVSYSVGFPSVAAAVDASGVRIRAFSVKSGAGTSACHDLVQKRKSDQDLGKPVAETELVTPCDLLQNPTKGQLAVPFGDYAILAVGFRGSDPLLIGCATTTVGENGGKKASIAMTLFSNEVSIKQSSCVDLSSHCKGGC